MRGRSLAILTVVAFVLTLLFAVASGAQETTTPAETTTPETTTAETTTAQTTASASASATADATETGATTAENLTGVDRAEGSFRCELFLRIDEDGFDGRFGRRHAGWLQYFDGDEDLLIRRIEECREREVLTGTIPDRKLPDTGGPPLLLAPWLLALVAAGVALYRRS